MHQGTAPWGGGGWALNTQPPEEGAVQGLRKCSHLKGQTSFLKVQYKDHLHQIHLNALMEMQIPDPSPDILNESLWGEA